MEKEVGFGQVCRPIWQGMGHPQPWIHQRIWVTWLPVDYPIDRGHDWQFDDVSSFRVKTPLDLSNSKELKHTYVFPHLRGYENSTDVDRSRKSLPWLRWSTRISRKSVLYWTSVQSPHTLLVTHLQPCPRKWGVTSMIWRGGLDIRQWKQRRVHPNPSRIQPKFTLWQPQTVHLRGEGGGQRLIWISMVDCTTPSSNKKVTTLVAESIIWETLSKSTMSRVKW